MSDWIKQVDLVLEDEGQQYGNMEEAATIARTPRTCFEIWSGDHRQTPGGLQQTEEAKKFRRKLLKRPLALRCPTQYIQPHGLADVVARYLEGHPDSPQVTLAVSANWRQATSCPGGSNLGRFGRTGGCQGLHPTEVQKAAVVILWLAMPGNEVANVLSTTFAEAAGLDGKQKWGLVLSSSARVTQMTYQTVIGVRYPEPVSPGPTGCTFGRFVPPDEDLRGGFLPVFWDVPRANLHAVVDVGAVGAVVDWLQLQFKSFRDAKSSLAVLHNQNDMVSHFKASSWVSEAQGAVVSRGVTTCAGMTAHTVIVAQTKVGFLSGGRRASFLELWKDS